MIFPKRLSAIVKTLAVVQERRYGLLVLPVVLLELAYVGPGDVEGDDEPVEPAGEFVVAGEVALGALVILELDREGEGPGLSQKFIH